MPLAKQWKMAQVEAMWKTGMAFQAPGSVPAAVNQQVENLSPKTCTSIFRKFFNCCFAFIFKGSQNGFQKVSVLGPSHPKSVALLLY